MIPKIIHQTWIDENIPAKNRFCVQSWKRLNPDYEYKFWTNEILIRFVEKEYPHYLNLLWKFKLGIQLADFFRLLILYHYGGIYVDIDFECLKPINTWELDDSKINFAYEPKEHRLDSYSIICNALICSPKRLESLIELIDSGEPIIDENPYEVMNSYGPWRCTNFYVENLNFRDNVNIIPTDLYYPIPDIFHETLYYDNNVRDKYIEKIEKKDFGNSNAVHYWDHSNVDKPSILKGLYHVYHANAEKEVIDLKNITLVCIDTISSNEEKCHTAIIKSTENIQFNSVKYFTYDIKNKLKGIEYIKIPELECINDYSKFCLTELHKYIDTDFCLIIQHDGYVINPTSWNSKFLDFDYIGAPWSDPLFKHKVGNGGFSLRSKKLLETTSRIFKNYPNIKIKNTVWENDILKEDWLICNAYYDEMIQEGIKFADIDTASCFSVEHPHSKMKPNPFGFHDRFKKSNIEISAIVHYSTLDLCFLKTNLKQLSKISSEIIVPICTHLFTGEVEDQQKLNESLDIIKTFPKATAYMFDWHGNIPNTGYYHNLSRKLGTEIAINDWLLFVDCDEILDEDVKPWVENYINRNPNCGGFWFTCYWYFRTPNYVANQLEGAGLLVKKEFCKWNLGIRDERQQLFNKIPNMLNGELIRIGTPEKVFMHHFSWVRSKEDMLRKVKNWGHREDKDWCSLVESEFSHPFNGTDFVHNYSYRPTDNKFNIKSMKYLITGHPRCGTCFMSKLFKYNGFDVGHEFMGENGTSNWQYAIPNDKCFPWTVNNRQVYDFDMVIHNVRDPYAAIPSIVFTETPRKGENSWRTVSEEFRRKYIQFPDTNVIENAVHSYLGWNLIIEKQNPDSAVRIEYAVEDLDLGFEDLADKKVNSREHKSLTKADWESIPETLMKQLDEFCIKYKYPILSTRI